MVYAYLAVAVALLLIELHNVAFYALFVAVGALAAALVAWLSPRAYAVQVLVAIAVAAFGVVVMRPILKRVTNRHHGTVGRGVHGGLIGQRAIAVDTVRAPSAPVRGHVLFLGESWLATSDDEGVAIEANQTVVITAVHGTTLAVRPLKDALTDAHAG